MCLTIVDTKRKMIQNNTKEKGAIVRHQYITNEK